MYVKPFKRKTQLQKLVSLVWKKGIWKLLELTLRQFFSPSHFSFTKFMVQFQKWRAETHVKACQQLFFHAVIDSVCKSEAHRYEWLVHGTKMYLSAWDTNPWACRLWFITTNIFSRCRFGACTVAPTRVSAWAARGTQQYFAARLLYQQAGSLSS